MHYALHYDYDVKLKITFLGTSASKPTTDRNLSCVCIEIENNVLMFDVGEGTQIAYLKSGLKWNKKMKLFITHLHGDHCLGILGLLQTMSIQQRTKPIEIYGPDGIVDFIVNNMKILNFNLEFPVFINTIDEHSIINEKTYKIYCCQAQHSIDAFSFLLEEVTKYGKFSPELAMFFHVPKGNMWKEIQDGNNVRIDGKIIKPSDIISIKKKNKKIGISGDTRPTKKLEKFFQGCDCLIFDSTFLHAHKHKALKTYHTTSYEAAQLAKNAHVLKLILTHFSTRYTKDDVFIQDAKKIYDEVICAKDFQEINI